MAENTAKNSIPLQSTLPPPFIPPLYKKQSFTNTRRTLNKSYISRTVSTEEPIPAPCINLSKSNFGNLSIPQFSGQDISLVSLTRTDTNPDISRMDSIPSTFASPEYSTIPMTELTDEASGLRLQLDFNNDSMTKVYEGIYHSDEVLDLTNIMTRCPQKGSSNDNPSFNQHNSANSQNDSNSERKHNKEHQKRSPNNNDNDNDDDDDKIDKDDDEYDDKCSYWRNTESSYSPHPKYKAQGFIKIPNRFTDTIVPNTVYERIRNVYDFINKSTAMVTMRNNAVSFDCDDSMIYNYDFHDENTKEILYCIVDRVNARNCICKYKMREKLYTQKEICDRYNVSETGGFPIARSSRHWKHSVQEIKTKLISRIREVLLENTKWNRVRVFNAKLIDNKQCKKQYNKQRLTFALTKTEFEKILTRFVCGIECMNTCDIDLIPMVMFSDDEYRVEYVQIMRIRDNIDIGISYYYHTYTDCIQVTGIHLNKECIMNQHQLIFPGHHCTCLDGFTSQIDNLRIGNPDEDMNRYKDVKSRTNDAIKDLTKMNETLQLKNDNLKTDNEMLKKQLGQLRPNTLPTVPSNQILPYPNINPQTCTFSQMYNMNMMRINIRNIPHMQTISSFIVANTPQTASTVTPAYISPHRNSFLSSVSVSSLNGMNGNGNVNGNVNVMNGFPNTSWPPAAPPPAPATAAVPAPAPVALRLVNKTRSLDSLPLGYRRNNYNFINNGT